VGQEIAWEGLEGGTEGGTEEGGGGRASRSPVARARGQGPAHLPSVCPMVLQVEAVSHRCR
jgi:hypothetical protein